MYPLLDQIRTREDFLKLGQKKLPKLAEEIREFLIQNVSKTGGHLAPNLGAVELTIALHHVFQLPQDKIIWDVGHQAYVHKILTDRKERFHTLRQFGGISGFPKISESAYDAFGVGHASTSISAALGLATGRDLNGDDNKVLAVIGDGAMTGGIAFEGLNNAGGCKRDLIVVLNDNNMSISPNVGALSKVLTQVITTPIYNRVKKDIWNLTGKLPLGSSKIRQLVQRIEEGIKAMVVPALLFERLGFRYFGPINGHNVHELIATFQNIKSLKGPILLHVLTTKGKGYRFAEEDATEFHGLGSFCPETGKSETKHNPTYTEIFGKTIVELAEKDSKVVGVTAAMAHGTGLIHLARAFPDRFFDVGIAEQHAVTFAAGMALEGFRPIVAIYSTFLQRAYDQVIHDVALQKIPIIFALDRGGIVGEDGPTHHGGFDLSYLRLIPNLVIMAPKDEIELRDMLWTALQYKEGPVAIRYPRGESYGLPVPEKMEILPIGQSIVLKEGTDLALLTIGDRAVPALDVAAKLEEEGISTHVVNMRFIKPIDERVVRQIAETFPAIATIENNTVVGGLGGAVAEILADSNVNVCFKRFGLPDRFVQHGSLCRLYSELHLDVESLSEACLTLVKESEPLHST
ncbi:1-deoxy-D-xylulose-5-phosphate synthase [candidate division KSB1 bacterium]|nr:1-deoxy-D-xylulose-5-phosphate synthase [candidate division KSB1 bacterium]